ncbi:MAG: HEAT repeat domain-containing protein [Acidimicrobiia bacterium]
MARETVRDDCRQQVAARGLTSAAVAYLTRDALGRIELSVLAPVKGLLKRYFSQDGWTADDDRALADFVGPGDGWWEYELDEDLVFAFGWRDGAFRLDVTRTVPDRSRLLAETFEQPVVPEATPNPRTIRFVTGPIHDGPSRWYESAQGVDDPRVARLFGEFGDVDNVLVGPDFVAVGLRRPDLWEDRLVPVLRVVVEQFASPSQPADVPAASPGGGSPVSSPAARERQSDDRPGHLERAWRELGRLRPDRPDDLERIVAALSSSSVADRQVAARVVADADPDTARAAWERLLDDPSRSVRRAAVDAMDDAERPALRPLLERALRDPDAWIRWKAISGLVGIGIESSRSAVAPLASDTDFRVRLETAAALRRGE